MTITITRLYDDDATAQRAVRSLEAVTARGNEGVARDSAATTWMDVIAAIAGAVAIMAALVLLVIPGLGALVFGAIVGTLIHRAMSDKSIDVHAEKIQRGGVLVMARVPDSDQARLEAILDRTAAEAGSPRPPLRRVG